MFTRQAKSFLHTLHQAGAGSTQNALRQTQLVVNHFVFERSPKPTTSNQRHGGRRCDDDRRSRGDFLHAGGRLRRPAPVGRGRRGRRRLVLRPPCRGRCLQGDSSAVWQLRCSCVPYIVDCCCVILLLNYVNSRRGLRLIGRSFWPLAPAGNSLEMSWGLKGTWGKKNQWHVSQRQENKVWPRECFPTATGYIGCTSLLSSSFAHTNKTRFGHRNAFSLGYEMHKRMLLHADIINIFNSTGLESPSRVPRAAVLSCSDIFSPIHTRPPTCGKTSLGLYGGKKHQNKKG